MVATNDPDLEDLQCPGGCGRLLTSPIRLCREGHSVCERHRRGACPQCGAEVLELRDARLEAVARAVPAAPCAHRARGCAFRAPLDALARHQRSCALRLAPCPLAACPWSGTPDALPEHAACAHADCALPPGEHLAAAELLRGAGAGHRLLTADSGDVFLFRHRLEAGGAPRLFAALHYVGLQENASNFRFSFELTSAAGTVRQVLPVVGAPEDDPLTEDAPFTPEKSVVIEGDQLSTVLNDADAKVVVRVRQVKCQSALPNRRTSLPWF